MKRRWRAVEEDLVVDHVEDQVWEDTGWASTASTGAVANWSLLARWTVWLLLVVGFLMGTVAFLSSRSPAAAPVTPVPRQQGVDPDQAGPAGFADLYVTTYLTAGAGSEDMLTPFYPGAADDGSTVLTGKPGTWKVVQVAPVRVTAVAVNYWSVVVAAQVTGPGVATPSRPSGDGQEPSSGLRYFQVGVRGGAGGLVAVALPAEVSAPTTGTSPSLDYGEPQAPTSSDPAAQTLMGFFGAYLTGAGQLERYCSPGTTLTAVTPAPYASVVVSTIAGPASDDADGAPSQTVPADGTRRHLLVNVVGTTSSGAHRPMTYAIELAARAGRWEVAALEAAPDLDPTAAPTPSASPSTEGTP